MSVGQLTYFHAGLVYEELKKGSSVGEFRRDRHTQNAISQTKDETFQF
jgi:hypothetical protein